MVLAVAAAALTLAFAMARAGVAETPPGSPPTEAVPPKEAPPPAATSAPAPTPAPAANPLLSIKFSGLLQVWLQAGDKGTTDTFRVRRGELKAVGQVGPKVRWTVMVDPAKSLTVNKVTETLDGKPVL